MTINSIEFTVIAAGSGYVAARNMRQERFRREATYRRVQRPRPDTPAFGKHNSKFQDQGSVDPPLIHPNLSRVTIPKKRRSLSKKKSKKYQSEGTLPKIGAKKNHHHRRRFVHRVRYAVYGAN